ncbi:MAG: PD-(D/E)XK nuclease family protein [marine benthic group bacterium]|nr:PD-(D/E)XK nuclease family protein [Gemmatimonadota bacterium]
MRRLSQTQIRTWRTCPQKWKQVYLEGRREPPAPPLTFGSAVHSGLETFYRNRTAAPATPEEMLASFDDVLDRSAYDSDQAFERARDDGHAMLQAWYERHAPEFRPAMAVELALRYDIDDVQMISILDRVDLTATGRLRITDYKTGRFFLRDTARESQQLTLYQIAAEERIERPVESLSLVHVPSDTEWEVPRRTAAEIDEVRRVVVDTANQIEQGAFEPRPGRHCEWCHVRPWCPAFADHYPENWPEQPDILQLSRDEVAELADALGQALSRKKQTEREIADLRDRLTSWFEVTGERAAAGSEFRIRATRSERDDDRVSWRLTPVELEPADKESRGEPV